MSAEEVDKFLSSQSFAESEASSAKAGSDEDLNDVSALESKLLMMILSLCILARL